MYIRQSDLFVSAAILMYIVFFALSPPEFVRTILTSPIGMSASFGVAVYVALYHSKAIGGLLIVALLASMTQVTEHLATGAWSSGSAYNTGDTMTLNGKTYTALFGNNNMGIDNPQFTTYWREASAPASGNSWTAEKVYNAGDTMTLNGKTYTALFGNNNMGIDNPQFTRYWREASVDRPSSSGSTPATPPVTAPPPADSPPKPTMSCNLENFASC